MKEEDIKTGTIFKDYTEDICYIYKIHKGIIFIVILKSLDAQRSQRGIGGVGFGMEKDAEFWGHCKKIK